MLPGKLHSYRKGQKWNSNCRSRNHLTGNGITRHDFVFMRTLPISVQILVSCTTCLARTLRAVWTLILVNTTNCRTTHSASRAQCTSHEQTHPSGSSTTSTLGDGNWRTAFPTSTFCCWPIRATRLTPIRRLRLLTGLFRLRTKRS